MMVIVSAELANFVFFIIFFSNILIFYFLTRDFDMTTDVEYALCDNDVMVIMNVMMNMMMISRATTCYNTMHRKRTVLFEMYRLLPLPQ